MYPFVFTHKIYAIHTITILLHFYDQFLSRKRPFFWMERTMPSLVRSLACIIHVSLGFVNKHLILHGSFVLPELSGRWCHHLDGFGARKETGGACVHGPERICVPLKVRDPEKAYGRPLEDPV